MKKKNTVRSIKPFIIDTGVFADLITFDEVLALADEFWSVESSLAHARVLARERERETLL